MANGSWYGTKEEWERIEGPLCEIDEIIDSFANEHGLTVEKNRKDWPGRAMEWGNEVRCLIQLYLVDEKSLIFNLWLCASEDRGIKRFWKQKNLIEKMPASLFKDSLSAQLVDGYKMLLEWSKNKDDLEFATTIG